MVLLVGALQFIINMIFTMAVPLAPMFSRDLGIPSQSVGVISGAYIVASATSSFIGVLYLDRFDRRTGLAVGILGLVAGAVMTGFAPNLPLLVASRVLTGIFSGPAYSLAIATLIDNVPVERRGWALGAVTGAGSLSLIVGVPFSLAVAQAFDSWRAPFFAVAGCATIIGVWGLAKLAPQRKHLSGPVAQFSSSARLRSLWDLLTRPVCALAYLLQGVGAPPFIALSTIMPVFLVYNLGYPNSDLWLVYLVGGGSNFFILRIIGRLADRFGATPNALGMTAILSLVICFGYLGLNPGLPLLPIFSLFFVTNSARSILIQTTTMRIPKPAERAGFQALGQSIQSMSMGLTAMSITYLVGSAPDGRLLGVGPLAEGILAVVWMFPLLLYWVERILDRQHKSDEAGPESIAALENTAI